MDCETCQAGVSQLGANLTSDEVEKEVMSLCKLVAQPQECTDGVDKYWEGMANVTFSNAQIPAYICHSAGLCDNSTM
jgi:hypothetical protein